MYEPFFGFREKPFSLLPDPAFLYLGRRHSMALAMLEYGIRNQAGFTVVAGEIGAGKTTLIRRLLDSIDTDVTVGLISHTHSSFSELLEWVLLAFGLDTGQASVNWSFAFWAPTYLTTVKNCPPDISRWQFFICEYAGIPGTLQMALCAKPWGKELLMRF